MKEESELIKTAMTTFYEISENYNLREKLNDDAKYYEIIYNLAKNYVNMVYNFGMRNIDIEKLNDPCYTAKKAAESAKIALDISLNNLEQIIKELG